MRRFDRAAWTAVLIVTSGAAFGGSAPKDDGVDTGPVNAVWVDHDVSFTYTGFTSHYSCSGLESKVEYVLKSLGARPGYKVSASGCTSSGPELMPHVRIRAALPMAATPEVLAEIEKQRAKNELAARAGGKPVAATDAATAQFPATWHVVKFEGTPMSNVQDGDCELMEQLLDRVLKPMGVREVKGSGLNCVPNQISMNAVNLKLRVLAGPPADAPPAKATALR
jgi:hypothetical protein